MERLCEYLRKYYNVNILRLLPRDVQEIFKEAAAAALKKKRKIKGRPNLPLITLVNNLYEAAPPSPSSVSGPFTLSYHHSAAYGKQIYIFGESHGIELNCEFFGRSGSPDIQNFLEEVFETTPAFIDFYMEFEPGFQKYAYEAFVRIVAGDEPSYINEIRSKIFNCVFLNPECQWRNTVRAHWADPRNVFNEGLYHKIYYFYGQTSQPFFKKPPGPETLITLGKEIFRDYSRLEGALRSPKEFNDFLFESLPETPVVWKEVSRSTLDVATFRAIMLEFLTKYRGEIFAREPIKISRRMKFKDIKSLSEPLISPMMDLYQLARIFKRFDVGGAFQPEEPRNVISYGGNFHSRFLRLALDYLGFGRVDAPMIDQGATDESRMSARCLDLAGFVPLFSNF